MRYFFALAILALTVMNFANAENADAATEAKPESSPREISLLDVVAKFEQGKTTYAEVIGLLGKPAQEMSYPDGNKMIAYGGVSTSRNAASYIPIVGTYAGKVNTHGTTANLMFNKDNVLISKTTRQF